MSLSDRAITNELGRLLTKQKGGLSRVLLIVPDFTRVHSKAGFIANVLYGQLEPRCRVDLLEALGTHLPMTRAQCAAMYGNIPFERFVPHNWRTDTVKLGEVPGALIRELSEGLMDAPVDIEVNKRLFDGYDLILSIGQVVPHEVAGMANHAKNIFVGCGGAAMINASHMLGAFYGAERIMGRTKTPVRQVFDYAAGRLDLPLTYILTVTTAAGDETVTHGLFIGRGKGCFEEAAALARQKNITLPDTPPDRIVVTLDQREYGSMWLGNKAVYRTRMAIADGGELIILAPGVERFGEDKTVDALIRKYGYRGREEIIRLYRENADLRENMSAAAHLIHGSSDGRFSITYCTRHLTEAEVTGVGYNYMPYDEAVSHFREGGYRIENPALGLWADKGRLMM